MFRYAFSSGPSRSARRTGRAAARTRPGYRVIGVRVQLYVTSLGVP